MAITLALLQFDIAFGKPEENYAHVKELIERAVQSRPDIIVLPELWTTGYDLTRLDTIADDHGDTTKRLLANIAKKYQVNIVAGSVAKRNSKGQVFNTTMVFNRDGLVIGEYDKVHLFRLMDEEKYLEPGNKKGLFTLEGVPAAGVICYDIRFPEWIRSHTSTGAEWLFVPAEWPTPRIEHWRTLLQSRAIENQAYVIACNRVGSDPNNAFGGHSMVIDPWGEIVAEASDQEDILLAEVNPDIVKEIRKMIPIYEDRRPELYQ